MSLVVTEAKEWIGTPYRHQGMIKYAGTDCVGLVVGVGVNSGHLTIAKSDIKEYSGYARTPNPKIMGKFMRKHLVEVSRDESGVGDILWMHWREGLPMHLAIISEKNKAPSIIHAASEFKYVVEQRYSDKLKKQTDSYWRFK